LFVRKVARRGGWDGFRFFSSALRGGGGLMKEALRPSRDSWLERAPIVPGGCARWARWRFQQTKNGAKALAMLFAEASEWLHLLQLVRAKSDVARCACVEFGGAKGQRLAFVFVGCSSWSGLRPSLHLVKSHEEEGRFSFFLS